MSGNISSEILQKYWAKQTDIHKQMISGFEVYLTNNHIDIKKAFEYDEVWIDCIDERTKKSGQSSKRIGLICLPASGVGEPEKTEKLIRSKNCEMNITLTTHDDCAAMKDLKDKAKSSLSTSEYGMSIAKEIAENTNIQYKYIDNKQMIEHPGKHIARVIYCPLGEMPFNPANVDGLLPGFVVHYLDNYGFNFMEVVEFSVGVAREHGLGYEKFTKEEPLLIVPIFDPYDIDRSSDLVNKLKKFEEKYDGLVKVDNGIKAPQIMQL